MKGTANRKSFLNMSSKTTRTLSSCTAKNSKNKAPSTSEVLPKSVRNAPADLRLAIRRKQNAEVSQESTFPLCSIWCGSADLTGYDLSYVFNASECSKKPGKREERGARIA